ncbi:MAG: ABC transporter permease [Bacteroidales bacterium]|nr:ABC transporter permease [Bacteroidales bacterium]
MLKFLIEKELKQIVRNSFLPKLILVITSSTYFLVEKSASSHHEAMQFVEEGSVDAIVEIPLHFEKQMITDKNAKVQISANSINATKTGVGASYLNHLIGDYATELTAERTAVKSAAHSTFVSTLFRFNPHLNYQIFMVPAIMVMLLTMLTGFLPALNIVGEKESGTIEQMNVTPVKKYQFILGKLIPYWMIGFFALNICFGVAALVYGLTPAGSLWTIYLFALVYILIVSDVGLVISNHSNTIQQAMFVIFFFMMILILLSGLFTPVSSMPQWAQVITCFNPLRYFMEVMRAVYLKGSSFAELTTQFFALCGFAAVFSIWAVASYRKTTNS